MMDVDSNHLCICSLYWPWHLYSQVGDATAKELIWTCMMARAPRDHEQQSKCQQCGTSSRKSVQVIRSESSQVDWGSPLSSLWLGDGEVGKMKLRELCNPWVT